MLESFMHDASCFVTLTYDEEHLPEGGTLVKEHYQNFLKNLRERVGYDKIRYYFVGEYGDESGRPHYHAALFGLGPTEEAIINDSWKKGFTYTGDLTFESAQYIAGYVTKKMTHKQEKCTDRCKHPPLNGRLPEFAQASLKPGLGAEAVKIIAETLTTEHGSEIIAIEQDVPSFLKRHRKQLPLGRYLKRKLREQMGFPNTGAQEGWGIKKGLQVFKLLEDIKADPKNEGKCPFKVRSEMKKQKILNLETKQKIFGSKKGIL